MRGNAELRETKKMRLLGACHSKHSSTSGLRQLARAQVRRGLVHIAVPWGEG